MRSLRQDLRYALRMLWSNIGSSALIVFILALGIGANSAIFSVIDAVLLKPLAYPDSERLVAIFSQVPEMDLDHFRVSSPEYTELRDMARSFSSLGAYTSMAVDVMGHDQPQRVTAAETTASLLVTLGAKAQLGRLYSPADEVPGSEPVVVLGDSLWHQAFAADPAIVGRRIQVEGAERTVIGVSAPGFTLPGEETEIWMPFIQRSETPRERSRHILDLIGRLRPGVSLEQARREMTGLLERWPREVPEAHVPDRNAHPIAMEPLLDSVVGDVRPTLKILSAAVLLVLLISCANVASLLLARAEARQQEIAVRTALGAGYGRLLRQFVTESVLLSLLGGAVGLLFAYWGVHTLIAAGLGGLPRLEEVQIDQRELSFTVLLSLLTGMVFGLAPAWHARTQTLFRSLQEGSRKGSAGRNRQRLRRGLAVAQLALATLLLINGGLLLRSFAELQRVDPGFRAGGVLSMRLSLPKGRYPDSVQVRSFYQRLLPALQGIPGVEQVAAMKAMPLNRYLDANSVVVEGWQGESEAPPVDYWQIVSPEYFKVMGIPLVTGRLFQPSDAADAPGVVLVNETMARAFWPGRNPLGQRLRAASDGSPWVTVVGVVKDVKQSSLDAATGTELYFPIDQAAEAAGSAPRSVNLVLRTKSDPARLAQAVREQVGLIDPALPVSDVRTLDDVVQESISRPRTLMLLVLIFASVALILAAVGTYGVLAYGVTQRTREIGVRMALGAPSGSVLAMVLTQGARMVIVGLALGLTLALALGRLLSSLLFQVSPSDPMSFLVASLLLVAVSFVALYVPARRATRVQPAIALRQE